jgi:rRNA maturation protein Nop10
MFYFKIVDGKKTYTLSEKDAEPVIPAKYTVEDRFSNERIKMKLRHKIFPFND